MKNILTILLLSVYLILSAGLNVIVHTCGGESETILATTRVEDPCGCTDEAAADRCCTTEVSTIKIDDAQKTTMATVNQHLTVLELLPVNSSDVNVAHDSEFISQCISLFSPPPLLDRNISNSVFRI